MPDEAHQAGAGPASWPVEQRALALEAGGIGQWEWDAATDLVRFSPRAALVFGLAPGATMTWAALRDRLHPDDREMARLAVERALAERADYSLEYRVVERGRERWVTASGVGRYDAAGEPVGMYGIVRDNTPERVLVQVDEAVRSLSEPDVITYTAARLLGQGLDVHRCAYAVVADDEDTFFLTGNYTNGVGSIVGEYRFRQFGAECLRLMRAGEPYVVEDSERDPRVAVEDRPAYRLTAIRAVVCVPIMKGGRFVAAMAVHMREPRRFTPTETRVVQQVASRCWESLERARITRERERLLEGAEAANRAKDEFLAMLGHELRNPLAPIVTALALLRDDQEEGSLRARTVIERQVTHLTRLVDDLLDVSRIARGKVVLREERVELSAVVEQAVEMASPALELRQHHLELSVPRQGLVVRGDAARLAQIVSNLLTNACKYTPPGGNIAVRAAREDDAIVLRVRDDGIGISGDLLPHVFDSFVQGHQASDRAQGGLGLGLTIAKNLVELHGGHISAASEGHQRGSEITVRLPAGPPDPAPRASTEPPPRSSQRTPGNTRVLLVDDNEDAADMLALALERVGCAVTIAHTAPDALEITAGETFTLALLDIGLPVMDGYELAVRLRQQPTMRDAHLVALTGYGQASDRARALEAGFDEHFVKPIALSTLEELVVDVAAGRASGRSGRRAR